MQLFSDDALAEKFGTEPGTRAGISRKTGLKRIRSMDATIPAYGYLVKPMDPYRLERTVADALTGSSAKDRLEPQP